MCTYRQLGNFQFPTHTNHLEKRDGHLERWHDFYAFPGCGLSFCHVRHYRPLRLEKTPDCSFFCVLLLQLLLSSADQLSDAWFMMSLYLMALSLYIYDFMVHWILYAAYISPWVHSSVTSRLRTQWPQGLRRSCNPTFFPFQFQKIVCQPCFGGWNCRFP